MRSRENCGLTLTLKRFTKSGYESALTDRALDELKQTFGYLEQNFSEREIRRLAKKLESIFKLISNNPQLYPRSNRFEGVRRALVTRHNTIYYRIDQNNIEILSFFSNRRDPESVGFD